MTAARQTAKIQRLEAELREWHSLGDQMIQRAREWKRLGRQVVKLSDALVNWSDEINRRDMEAGLKVKPNLYAERLRKLNSGLTAAAAGLVATKNSTPKKG